MASAAASCATSFSLFLALVANRKHEIQKDSEHRCAGYAGDVYAKERYVSIEGILSAYAYNHYGSDNGYILCAEHIDLLVYHYSDTLRRRSRRNR